MNAIQNPSKKVFHIPKTHNALVFIKSLHEVKDGCVTYMVLGDEDQTIISNYDEDNPDFPFREISASNKEIRIRGAKTKLSYVSIEHKAKETDWTTVFVEWSNNGQCTVCVNGKVGTFTCQETLEVEEEQFSIGGRFDGSRLINGEISALEIYG